MQSPVLADLVAVVVVARIIVDVFLDYYLLLAHTITYWPSGEDEDADDDAGGGGGD